MRHNHPGQQGLVMETEVVVSKSHPRITHMIPSHADIGVTLVPKQIGCVQWEGGRYHRKEHCPAQIKTCLLPDYEPGWRTLWGPQGRPRQSSVSVEKDRLLSEVSRRSGNLPKGLEFAGEQFTSQMAQLKL